MNVLRFLHHRLPDWAVRPHRLVRRVLAGLLLQRHGHDHAAAVPRGPLRQRHGAFVQSVLRPVCRGVLLRLCRDVGQARRLRCVCPVCCCLFVYCSYFAASRHSDDETGHKVCLLLFCFTASRDSDQNQEHRIIVENPLEHFLFVCLFYCFTAHAKSASAIAVHYSYRIRELRMALPSLSAVALPVHKGYL